MNRRSLFLFAPALALPADAATRPETKARLIAGERSGGVWQAGLALEIGEDWKTYWRMPGDAGIPPDFDWSASENLSAVEILFPAPDRYNDAAGESIGYKSRVILPLRVTAADAAKPVILRLKLFFAVCKDICIPSRAEVELALTRSDPGGASLIAAAEARVPQAGGMIRHARLVDGALELDMPEEPGLDIFVEGAEPAYVSAPQWTGGVYRLPLKGLKDEAALRGKTLRVTMASPNISLEQSVTVE